MSLVLAQPRASQDYPEVWGPQLADIFSRTRYEPEHELEAAIASTGHSYKDIKAIVIVASPARSLPVSRLIYCASGHLHLDHAGGLDLFKELKDIPIWVHERELKGAFYSVATVGLPLLPAKPFESADPDFSFFQGRGCWSLPRPLLGYEAKLEDV